MNCVKCKAPLTDDGIEVSTGCNEEGEDYSRITVVCDACQHDIEFEVWGEYSKGDAKEEYPSIKKILGILQDQNINKFSLITSLRAGEE